jgi:hypothetical protein
MFSAELCSTLSFRGAGAPSRTRTRNPSMGVSSQRQTCRDSPPLQLEWLRFALCRLRRRRTPRNDDGGRTHRDAGTCRPLRSPDCPRAHQLVGNDERDAMRSSHACSSKHCHRGSATSNYRSTRCARETAGSNRSAKYCVSLATRPSRNCMMLTA